MSGTRIVRTEMTKEIMNEQKKKKVKNTGFKIEKGNTKIWTRKGGG